ncbi:MAG: hypothetical protein IPL97_02910 [Niastella sp.]|nr:hypothetical protein [Niastella sp.]
MKKIVLILAIIMAITKNVEAQTYGVPDTLAYLQTIIANKANFIGQPFSTLLNDLQIQVNFFPRLQVFLMITLKKLQLLLHFIFLKQKRRCT